MDFLNKTKELCKLYNIRPARSKGQNFLVRELVYDKIVEVSAIRKDDTILEVGPGLGFLTAKIAEKAKKVIAVELDDKLANFLQIGVELENSENIEIRNEDVLDFNYKELPEKYKIVANLPYNITSVFLRKILTSENKPELAVLMLQKEVAERIVAEPGDMSKLAISVQFYAKAEIFMKVPKEDFYPQPEVNSAVIKMIIKTKDEIPQVDEKEFFRLVKIGFSAKRKMLKNNLSAGFKIKGEEAESILEKAGLSKKVRAEDLSIDNWVSLLEYVT